MVEERSTRTLYMSTGLYSGEYRVPEILTLSETGHRTKEQSVRQQRAKEVKQAL